MVSSSSGVRGSRRAVLVAVLFVAVCLLPRSVDGSPNRKKHGRTDVESVDADQPASRGELSRDQIPPYYRSCGKYKICDLRTHYCDSIIDGCARCDDDCHPARIVGNRAAVAECERNCALWYATKSTSTTPVRPSNDGENASRFYVCGHQFDITTTLLVVACSSVAIAVLLVFIAAVLVYRTCCVTTTGDRVLRLKHQRHSTTPAAAAALLPAAAIGHVNLAYVKSPVPPPDVTSLLQPPSYDSSV